MAKVRLLLYYGVKPILVFDGAHLPMKRHQENQRAHSRRTSRNKANELLAAGNDSAAHIHIQKAADITPQMAAQLIVELQKAGVQYVVAPYEADAQMAYLDQVGMVSAVITEDSDLLLFGCKRVLFKLDSNGSADEICIRRLGEATELDFSNFSLRKVHWQLSSDQYACSLDICACYQVVIIYLRSMVWD
jgi:exonuclease-1